MLLSRQALPTPVPNEPAISPTFAMVAMMTDRLLAPARAIGEAGANSPAGAGDGESAPQGPIGFVDIAAEPTDVLLRPDGELPPIQPSLDDAATDGVADAGDETLPPKVPDSKFMPIPLPLDGDWIDELIHDGLDTFDAIPWQGDYTLEGWLDASRSQVAYRIPVGPGTNSMWFAVRPGRDSFGPPPMIDAFYLVDPAGDILAKITTTSVGGEDDAQFLVALQGAPEGSQLVVHLAMRDVQPPASPEAGGSAPDGAPAGDSPSLLAKTTFELNIQRNDPDPPSAEGNQQPVITMPAPSQPTIPSPAPARADAGSGILMYAQAARLSLDGLGRGGPGLSVGGGSSTSAFSWTEAGRSAGGRSPSVYLGPLVSRVAAPLGPTLATSVDEPTELIDRENLAVDEALDRIGTELDSELLAGLKHRDGSAATRAIPGAGGLPILVAATPHTHVQGDADALTANLQSRSVAEALIAEAPDADASPTTERGAEGVRIASAGLITRAAGLVIGLGLATGPLYPDLVALARRRIAQGKRTITRRRWTFRRRPTRPVF